MILGLKKKTSYNFVELVGPPNIGKSILTSTLSMRAKGKFIEFPKQDITNKFDWNSILLRKTEIMENSPKSFLLSYMASMTSHEKEILESIENFKGDIFVTNYLYSFKYWWSVLVGEQYVGSFFGLPLPNKVIYLDIPIIPRTYSFEGYDVNISENLNNKFKRHIKFMGTKKTKVVVQEDTSEDRHPKYYLSDALTQASKILKIKDTLFQINSGDFLLNDNRP